MASNPLVAQGTLNRLRATVVIPDFPELNVTASFLGPAGVSLALEGESTRLLPTLTGTVTSPEPYQMTGLTINLLRTQNLANLWKLQMESSALIGAVTVKPDASTLSDYQLNNCAIESVRELSFAGQDAGYVVMVKGYYLINNSLWGL